MNYKSNIICVAPQQAYNCCYSALMSFYKPEAILDSQKKVITTPSLLTVYATIQSCDSVIMYSLITVEALDEEHCRLHIDVDDMSSRGNQAFSIRFLADYLDRFATMLKKNP